MAEQLEGPEPPASKPGFSGMPFERQLAVVVAGLVIVTLVDRWIDSLSSDDPAATPPTSTSTTSPSASADTTEPQVEADRPEVPPIHGCGLLTDEEVEEGLGIADLDFADRGVIAFGRSEGCVWQHQPDGETVEGLSIQIAPGDPVDFTGEVHLDGVAGVETGGVGAAARWFAGDGVGILSVVDGTDLGAVFLRVVVSRPDLDDPARLEVATQLAAAAGGGGVRRHFHHRRPVPHPGGDRRR